jgi:hypothetical protein
MSEATRLRAQKAYSTDPEYLERMAVAEEARDVCPPYEQVQTTVSAEAEVTRE